ncbi:hypothetical protein, partial [Acinetobacter baumannii]|uniref:hypothetical protein n=1 Tax=Acinetobacter baumannii TaxID=470 RepID=UPI00280DCCB2
MSELEILESAPKDATHYFLVPNGSGEPYYVLEKEKKFYWFHGQDEITMIYAELSGDFPLGDSRQPIYKSLRPF